jgi:rare lipoprotein A (peptidoglycan hydrolase)
VRVENLSNGRSTRWRSTDRGPFTQGRLIDRFFELPKEVVQFIEFGDHGRIDVELLEKFGNGIERPPFFL